MALALASGTADEIYTAGPETLVSGSFAIVTGPVSGYAKQVTALSEPGPNGYPMRWTVTGRIEKPEVLKGSSPGPIAFSRSERSLNDPRPRDIPDWEIDYGALEPGGAAVLFLSGPPARPVVTALPTGPGDQDLAGLARDISGLEATPDGQATDAWLAYLDTTRRDAGRRAALRVLVSARADWHRLEPVLQRLLTNPQLSPPTRAFIFGLVAFGIAHHAWPPGSAGDIAFLCEQFETERDDGLVVQYALHLKLLLMAATRDQSTPGTVKLKLAECLNRRVATGPLPDGLREQYRQIRAMFPGLLPER